ATTPTGRPPRERPGGHGGGVGGWAAAPRTGLAARSSHPGEVQPRRIVQPPRGDDPPPLLPALDPQGPAGDPAGLPRATGNYRESGTGPAWRCPAPDTWWKRAHGSRSTPEFSTEVFHRQRGFT